MLLTAENAGSVACVCIQQELSPCSALGMLSQCGRQLLLAAVSLMTYAFLCRVQLMSNISKLGKPISNKLASLLMHEGDRCFRLH